MLSPRLTNCPECANIPSLLKKIDCRLAELGNNLYNNISYMLNKPVPSSDILQLIGYRRILMYKYCNPSYVEKYSVQMIASRVIRLTAGCVSKCNELERCLEEPCDIKIVPNPTTTSTSTLPITTTTSTSSTSSTTTTSTTVVPTTTTTSSSSTSTTTSTSSSTSTTTSTTTVVSTQWIIFASFNPYSACQQIDGENVTVYTSTPFLGNGVTLYLDAGLTIPYVSNPSTSNVLSDGTNHYFLGDTGGAVIVFSGSCAPFVPTTTTTSSSSTTTTTTTLEPTTTTTTTVEPLRYFYNATFYNCGDCVTPSGAGSFNNSQPLTAGMYYINSSGIIIYINSFNSVVPGISTNNILDSSQQVNCGDIVCPTTTTTTTLEPTTTTTTTLVGCTSYDFFSVVGDTHSIEYIPCGGTSSTTLDIEPGGGGVNACIASIISDNYPDATNNVGPCSEPTTTTTSSSSTTTTTTTVEPTTTTTTSSSSTTTTTTTAGPVSSILGPTGIRPYGITIDSLDNIYTGNGISNDVTKITPAGVSTILGTTGSFPLAITIDASDNIYTANQASNNVTKITPAGVSSIFGTTGTSPVDITIDPSGNIYTANQGSNNITKITPSGVSSIFATTGSGFGPTRIISDSSGNIYTISGVNTPGQRYITKVTPSGVTSSILVSDFGEGGMAIDSAGNIYIGDQQYLRVVKVTPAGVESVYGTTGSGPVDLVFDSVGNLYVSNLGSNNVTKITPLGVSTILGTTQNEPYGITIDPAGNIYTANSFSNNVTKITV